MKFSLKPTLIAILSALVLTGCQLNLPFTAKKAGINITSTPTATVFIDAKHVGQTPYQDDSLKAGDITVKLVPEGNSSSSWETKVALAPKIVTVINREFGPTLDQSAGETLSMEPLGKKDATSLTIISTPDSAVAQLDGQPQGFTPISLDDISAGDHTITLSSPGFKDRTVTAKVVPGYKLTVNIQLARIPLEQTRPQDEEATLSANLENDTQPSPSPKAKASPAPTPAVSSVASASATAKSTPYVEILDNPVGFLRVREQATTSSTELARAYPGQKLPYQGEESNGWYKVTYAPGKTGWVARSGPNTTYAKLVQ